MRLLQIVRTTQPLNTEPTLDALVRELVTPSETFYVRNHGNVPEIDAERFALTVDGLVTTPLRLSMSDVRNEFEKITVMAALACAGNRRSEMAAVAPIPGEVAWGAQAIGNAIWAGARLRDVLRAAGPLPQTRHVAFLGADEIEKEGKRIGFGASVALERAMTAEPILAYEMNGLPLEPIHGRPLRGVVPGYIGARSVKWLTSITLQESPSDNFYQARSYRVFPPDVTAQTAVWERGTVLQEVGINSVICLPRDGAALQAGSLGVSGYAIGAGGSAVVGVDVSADGGATWTHATLLGKREPWRWNLWEARLTLTPGVHELVARARDERGGEQPKDGAPSWNFKGYGWNAWHRVRIRVD